PSKAGSSRPSTSDICLTSKLFGSTKRAYASALLPAATAAEPSANAAPCIQCLRVSVIIPLQDVRYQVLQANAQYLPRDDAHRHQNNGDNQNTDEIGKAAFGGAKVIGFANFTGSFARYIQRE